MRRCCFCVWCGGARTQTMQVAALGAFYAAARAGPYFNCCAHILAYLWRHQGRDMISLCMCAFISHRCCCCCCILFWEQYKKSSWERMEWVSLIAIYSKLCFFAHWRESKMHKFDVPHIMRYILARTQVPQSQMSQRQDNNFHPRGVDVVSRK